MQLIDKGPIAPPPILSRHLQFVSERIQSWPKVIAATHWDLYSPSQVDGADFYLRDDESGHIHLQGEVHIPLTASDHSMAIAAGMARRFRFSAYGSGAFRFWVEADVRNSSEAEIAVTLFEMSYQRSRANIYDERAAASEPQQALESELTCRHVGKFRPHRKALHLQNRAESATIPDLHGCPQPTHHPAA